MVYASVIIAFQNKIRVQITVAQWLFPDKNLAYDWIHYSHLKFVVKGGYNLLCSDCCFSIGTYDISFHNEWCVYKMGWMDRYGYSYW